MDSLQPAILNADDTVVDYCFGEIFEKNCLTRPRVVGFDAENTAGGEEWEAVLRPHPCFIAFFSPLFAAACLEAQRVHLQPAPSLQLTPSPRKAAKKAAKRAALELHQSTAVARQLQGRPPPARLVAVASAPLQDLQPCGHASGIGDDGDLACVYCDMKCSSPATAEASAEVALIYLRGAATDKQSPLLIRAPFWPGAEPESAAAHSHTTGSTYVLRCESGGAQCALSVTRQSPLADLWVIRMQAVHADPATTAACAREFTASESTVRDLAALTRVRLLD